MHNIHVNKVLCQLLSLACPQLHTLSCDVLRRLCTTVQQFMDTREGEDTTIKILQLLCNTHQALVKVYYYYYHLVIATSLDRKRT